uniref:Uncharacterized protein n=1 Tax=Rhizophora mucronata TaxID=61149 RepID=A0A2P2QJ01_RHIMU
MNVHAILVQQCFISAYSKDVTQGCSSENSTRSSFIRKKGK